jgi:hypothetical protein
MPKKQLLLILLPFISAGITVLDFFLFKITWAAFIIHNVLACIVASGFIAAAFYLMERKSGNFLYCCLIMVIGFSMLAIHINKLVSGNCT